MRTGGAIVTGSDASLKAHLAALAMKRGKSVRQPIGAGVPRPKIT